VRDAPNALGLHGNHAASGQSGKSSLSIMKTSEVTAHLEHAAKTGLAAVLAFYLARFLSLPESYWAAISAILVMYSDVSRTVKASGQRLVGTAIGVSVGGIFAALFGQHLWAFGAAVTLTVLVCALLGFAEAARLAGVAVAIVMLVSHPGRPWAAALHRFLEVSFGIVIAVLVSALHWPLRRATRS
jgi:uncharacterized membrane protein YgaE (UPF0421/DUF939 family)